MGRRGFRRFVLEVLFLAGVAAALTVADLRPAAVIVLMVIAWVIVVLLEWTAWLDEPHYGRGLPPRYYVPHVALPPLLSSLNERGLELSNLTTRHASLEDVFVKLTGRHLQETGPGA